MNLQRDILVIEDETSVSRAVEMVCTDAGMSVSVVSSATAALEVLDQHLAEGTHLLYLRNTKRP